jgi:hypothetical protein
MIAVVLSELPAGSVKVEDATIPSAAVVDDEQVTFFTHRPETV